MSEEILALPENYSVQSVSSSPYVYPQIELYEPLTIDPEKFISNYNLYIKPFVDKHEEKEKAQSKNGQLKRPILYLSYSHAMRLFRENHPGLEVACAVNPLTGGYLFAEVDRRGYFMKSFVHDGKRRSEAFYNALLTMSGQGIHPDDVQVDYTTKKPKLNGLGKPVLTVNNQSINKLYYRSIVKAIGMVTGIGLKLWTGEDLSDEVLEAKMNLLNRVAQLNSQYSALVGSPWEEASELSHISDNDEIIRIGTELKQRIEDIKSGKLNRPENSTPTKASKSPKAPKANEEPEEALAS